MKESLNEVMADKVPKKNLDCKDFKSFFVTVLYLLCTKVRGVLCFIFAIGDVI